MMFASQWKVIQDPENYDADVLTDFNEIKVTIVKPKLVHSSDLEIVTCHAEISTYIRVW
jgi:hypothetical protein